MSARNQRTESIAGAAAVGAVGAIETVADVPSDYALVQDSQEVSAILQIIGETAAVVDEVWRGLYGCLFVRAEDGDLTDVLAIVGSTPYLGKPVFRLYPPEVPQ